MATRNRKEVAGTIPVWSWVAAALGLLLVAGCVSFMLYQHFAEDHTPPLVAIAVQSVVPSGDGYVVTIDVTNRGSAVASGLVIEGVLSDTATAVETSTITIDYVPSGSHRQAGLYFTRDPGRFNLEIRPKGYIDP
jgi:uncharacterized protein (TIGR02588 family)